MSTDPEREAPNVVTEPRFRQLMRQGYQAEVVCEEQAFVKASVWYGAWVIRVIDANGTIEKLLVTTPRRASDRGEIKIRVFKTINGLSSFMHNAGFTHIHIPFLKGGRSTQALPNEVLETENDDA